MAAITASFQGLNVLDLSTRLSGAFAARLFGDFGADVVLAEPYDGHRLRHEAPTVDGVSSIHAYANWNKRSLGFAELDELATIASHADVIIVTELQTAATVTKWLNSQAVLLVVTAHGNQGELSEYPGNNLTTSARSGWSYCNRLRDEPPLQMPRYQSGYVGGIAGFIAGSAALRRRESEPQPERVDVSELEAFAHTVHPWGIMSIYADQGDAWGPTGWRPRGAAGPLWPAGGGQMHLAIGDFHNWTEAMDFLGLPQIANDPELIPDYGRHGRDLKPVVSALAQALPKLDRWDVFKRLAELRCVVGVVQDMGDLMQDPQYTARAYLERSKVAGNSLPVAGAPAKLAPAPWQLKRSAPQQVAKQPTEFASSSFTTASNAGAGRNSPLAGLRVLSFGQAWSGTYGSEILSLLGADVVQIGALQRPDVWRRTRLDIPPGVLDASKNQHALNTSGLYNSVNLNKRELTLNVKDPRGMDLFWQLVPNFDVLIDNFRATVMPSWGVTLEKLNQRRPGIVWASISGYGVDGPYRDYPANGASTEPMSGLSSLHGYAGDTGMNTAGLYPDPVSGYILATGIMAALHHRDRTGEAQRVDVSMMEALTTMCGDALLEYGMTGQVPRPRGNSHPQHAPHNHYLCQADQWLAVAVESEAQWLAFAELVGGEIGNELWRNSDYRKQHEPQLDELIGSYCRDRDAAQLEQNLCQRGIPAARVMPLYELYTQTNSPLHENGFIQQVTHPEAGASLLPGAPWHFSGSDALALRAAPCVGEHSKEILKAELGIVGDAYQALVDAGITGTLAEHR